MPSIDIEQSTYDRLVVTARLLDQPVGNVVTLLLDRLTGDAPPGQNPPVAAATARTVPGGGDLPVHALYKGQRVEGAFSPDTLELQVDSAPWSGRRFSSPTAAAQAVVSQYGSDRQSPNTNGRRFWKVTRTGNDLRSLIGERF